MAPRATWKGQLKLSLVSFPVRLHTAVSSGSRVSLNQLHRDCNQRLRQQMTCPEHGPVDRTDIARGYEYEKGKYVVIDDADLEHLKLETQKTIELLYFTDADALDSLYLNSSYYVAPDGPMGDDAFNVVREAMKKHNKIAVGQVVMQNKEHMVSLRVEGQGFILTTLRYAHEVRAAEPYFTEITQKEISDAHLQLAEQLIESHTAEFDPAEFKDRYQDALLELVKAKITGAEPPATPQQEAGKVINLMDALKASVEEGTRKKPPAKSVKKAAKKKTKAKAKRA